MILAAPRLDNLAALHSFQYAVHFAAGTILPRLELEPEPCRQSKSTPEAKRTRFSEVVGRDDEKRKRDLAAFRASCRRSLERAKDGEGTPFNPDTFLEDAKRWEQERDEAQIGISDDQKPADTLD